MVTEEDKEYTSLELKWEKDIFLEHREILDEIFVFIQAWSDS